MPIPCAGARSSAPGWRATSAGRQPLVVTQLFTWGSPQRRNTRGIEQQRVVLAPNRPAPVPKIEPWTLARCVPLRIGKRRQRADIAPVRRLLELLHARDAV